MVAIPRVRLSRLLRMGSHYSRDVVIARLRMILCVFETSACVFRFLSKEREDGDKVEGVELACLQTKGVRSVGRQAMADLLLTWKSLFGALRSPTLIAGKVPERSEDKSQKGFTTPQHERKNKKEKGEERERETRRRDGEGPSAVEREKESPGPSWKPGQDAV